MIVRTWGGIAINERARELEQLAEQFAHSMSQQFDERLDFSVESLARLDGSIAQWRDLSEAYSGHDPQEVLRMAVPLAAYVGEVFRRQLRNGEWVTVEEEDQIAPPHIRLDNGMRINVMKKAIGALSGVEAPAFAGYFTVVAELATTRPAGEPEEDQNGIRHAT